MLRIILNKIIPKWNLILDGRKSTFTQKSHGFHLGAMYFLGITPVLQGLSQAIIIILIINLSHNHEGQCRKFSFFM